MCRFNIDPNSFSQFLLGILLYVLGAKAKNLIPVFIILEFIDEVNFRIKRTIHVEPLINNIFFAVLGWLFAHFINNMKV